VLQPKLYGQYSVRFFDQHLAGMTPQELTEGDGLIGQLPQPLSEPTRLAYAKYTKPQRTKRKAPTGPADRR
jgi:hypothetical protein